MSSLRQCLKTPQLWLGVLAALALAFFGDTFRAPSRQLSPRLYGGLVSGYRWTKSQIGVKPRCRFSPSCSQYSQQAVRRYGLWKGLGLTFRRLCRCRTNVPPETRDPLPGVASYQDRHELASFLPNYFSTRMPASGFIQALGSSELWKMTGQEDNVGFLATGSGVQQFQLSLGRCFVHGARS